MELTKKELAGIILAIITLSSGTTWLIEDAGSKTSCRAGWEYITEGEFEGQFKCVTQSGERNQICYEVYDSANTENYWCQKGKESKEVEIYDKGELATEYLCNPTGCKPKEVK